MVGVLPKFSGPLELKRLAPENSWRSIAIPPRASSCMRVALARKQRPEASFTRSYPEIEGASLTTKGTGSWIYMVRSPIFIVSAACYATAVLLVMRVNAKPLVGENASARGAPRLPGSAAIV
jgi:hypothetical protein